MSEFSLAGLLRSSYAPFLMVLICVMPLANVHAQQQEPSPMSEQVNAGEVIIDNASPEAVPDDTDLVSPDQMPIVTDVAPTNAVLADDGTVAISAPSAYGEDRGIDGEDEFFDAENIVPEGEMANKGPIKVNPRTQPASKLITVTKDFEPDTKTARIVSAERAMSLGMYDSALTMFEALYADYPREPRVLMGKAVSLQKLERFDEAMKTYDVLANMDAKNINVKVNMLGLLATRYPAVALRQLLDLHSEHSENVGLTAQVAIAYAQSGDMQSAIRFFGVASSMEPQNAGHVYNMAIMADRSGDSKKAVQYYEQALEIDALHGSGRMVPRDVIYERLAQLR